MPRFRWLACAFSVAVSARATPPLVERDRGPEPRGVQPLIIATDRTPPPEPARRWSDLPRRGWHEGYSIGAGFGRAFVEGVDPGFWGRLELGAYEVQHRRRGFFRGVSVGVEGWRAGPADFGAGAPVLAQVGIQSDALFMVLGAGAQALFVDQVAGDTGVGFLAPEALADVGFDLEGVRFLLDARAGYRWQLGAPDRSSLRVGGVIQLTTD
ncbi:MAG: hypothetical protein HYZ29_22945 [Myxococcales bacterium]|nr:hypothetical protein [Myxococcales bacterium]